MIVLALPSGPLSIACLGAHPDDIEIGCGGTLLTLAASRELTVDYVLLTGTPDRQSEARAAAAAFLPGAEITYHLGNLPDGRLPAHWDQTKNALESVASSSNPQLVLAPRTDDAHQDHRLVAQLATTAWRDALVLQYEIPKWDGDLGRVTHYLPVSDEVASRKFALLDEHFASQRARDWWDDETFRSVLRLRGVECRAHYAEAFAVTKVVLGV